MNFFPVTKQAIDWLQERDPKLGAIIDRIGVVQRACMPNLFTGLVHSIIGQQISGKAHQSIWQRFLEACDKTVTPESVSNATVPTLREAGLSARKVFYVKQAAEMIRSGSLKVHELYQMEDEEVISKLCKLPGVGRWTAEMLLLFSLQRQDILSFADFGIRRGLRMVHQKVEITKQDFQTYRTLYSPFGSVAGLYLWEVAGGKCPDLVDPGGTKKKT